MSKKFITRGGTLKQCLTLYQNYVRNYLPIYQFPVSAFSEDYQTSNYVAERVLNIGREVSLWIEYEKEIINVKLK